MSGMRKGDWIGTYSGIQFYPLDPRPEDVSIVDIAHALSQICRYNGHSRFFYSVAQHSLLCKKEAKLRGWDERIQALCLIHDAAEAYISDITRPIKPYLSGLSEIEEAILGAVYERFNIKPPSSIEKVIIGTIDDILLATEARVLMPHQDWWQFMEPSKHIVNILPDGPFIKDDILSELQELCRSNSLKED